MWQLENRDVGRATLVITAVVFTYYTLWVIGLPFVDAEYKETVEAFFPPVQLALVIPSFVGTVTFTALIARAYYLVLVDRRADVKELEQAKRQ